MSEHSPNAASHAIVIGHAAPQLNRSTRVLELFPAGVASWASTAKKFLADEIKYESTTLSIFVDGDLSESEREAAESVIELAKQHYHHARINQNTVEETGERQALHFARNLRVMQHRALDMLPDMTGRACVIVGAGPSLDADLEQLRQHRGPMLAVNTSAGPLARAGIAPTAIVAMESKVITEGLALAAGGVPMLLDVTAHPDNVAAAKGPVGWFSGTEPNLCEYARTLGLLPLAYGSSSTTAAVALALASGAERVVLVGQDCAFGPAMPGGSSYDGGLVLRATCYASGTPYEDAQATIDTERGVVVVEGSHKPRTVHNAATAPAIGGGQVWSTHVMLSVQQWFEALPEWTRDKIVNCTSHGAQLAGIRHAALRDELDAVDNEPAYADAVEPMPAASVMRALTEVAAAGLSNAGNDQALAQIARRSPILQMWLSPDALRQRREATIIGPIGRYKRQSQVVARACLELAQALGIVRQNTATNA